jgi:hypothetical protein
MGIDRFLNHRVSIVRRVSSGEDAYGQPIVSEETIASDVAASIQPRSGRDAASVPSAGAAVSDHRIYLVPRDITTADTILHAQADCPVTNDLPDGWYELSSVPDAAGGGHHLELEARRVDAPTLALVTGS